MTEENIHTISSKAMFIEYIYTEFINKLIHKYCYLQTRWKQMHLAAWSLEYGQCLTFIHIIFKVQKISLVSKKYIYRTQVYNRRNLLNPK